MTQHASHPFTLGVDFDGTIVEHRYPDIGRLVPGAIDALFTLQDQGARLILWTVRGGVDLDAAVEFLELQGFLPWAVNHNPEVGSTSPKLACDAFVDDRAIGCPLIPDSRGRPVVDWSRVVPLVLAAMHRHGEHKP